MQAILLSTLVVAVLAQLGNAAECPLPSSDAKAFSAKNFDYIIVGGGTAGLTVAARIAEAQPHCQVGLLEAGVFHRDDPLVDTPVNGGLNWGNRTYDWAYVTTPQAGLNNTVVATPRGKMLGGSSGLNLMAWTRASQAEYDAFDKFAPGHGWTFKDLLPFLKKVENVDKQSNPFPGISSAALSNAVQTGPLFAGSVGPINVSLNTFLSGDVFPWVQSHNALGVATNVDPSDGVTSGVRNLQVAVNRASGNRSYVGYYCESVGRSNIHHLVGAQVTKVNLVKKGSLVTATGVQFLSAGKTFTAKAAIEVVLSAGVVNSPQLLELSGIGNSKLLKKLGIQTLIDLPGVGENLQEHIYSILEWQLKPGIQTFDELRNNATFLQQQAVQYQKHHDGVFTSTDSAVSYLPLQTFLNASAIAAQAKAIKKGLPELGPLTKLQKKQYSIQSSLILQGVPQVEVIQLSKGLILPQPNVSYMSVLVGHQKPLARGSIHINTTNATAPPVINGNYLNNDFDVQTILQGLKFALKLASTPPVSHSVAAVISPPPGLTDAQLISYIRATGSTGSHIMGTAAMAAQSDGGVVNGQLKVYGTKNLRVVDTSVIPLQLATHSQHTVFAIAEKAATMIVAANPAG